MNKFQSAGRENALTDFQHSLNIDQVYVKNFIGDGLDNRLGRKLRILSWNIGRGYNPAQLSKTLVSLQPDVACLQEVDWGNQRTDFHDILSTLAESTKMLGLFAIEFIEVNSRHRPAKLAGGGVTGNAILARFRPTAVFRVALPAVFDWQRDANDPRLPWRARWHIRRERRIGERCGIGAEFVLGARRLVICSAHLEDKMGGIAGRWAQYATLLRSIEARRRVPDVAVIAGDFNTFDCRLARLVTPDSDETALQKPAGVTEAQWWKTTLLPPTGYMDPFRSTDATFSIPPLFQAKLDWITAQGATVQDHGGGPFSSSDHRPIWADFDVST